MSFFSRLKLGGAGVLTVAMLVAGPVAYAQDIPASHLEAARKAISALGATDQFDNILPNAAEALKSQLIQQTPDLQPDIDATVDAAALELAPRRADLEKEAATVYAKTFSEAELNAIADFYNSDAGKKLIADGPIVTRELIKSAEIWTNGISRDLTEQAATKLHEKLGDRPKVEGLDFNDPNAKPAQ